MSEKQLTVAELMARSGKSSETTPRRRHRSLDEGGVSVAELTGSLPLIDAKPKESKHSSAPIDAENTDRVHISLGGDESSSENSSENTESVPSAVAQPDPLVHSVAPESSEEPVQEAQRTPSTEETVVLRVVTEDDPVVLTTGAFPAQPLTPRSVAPAEEPAEEPVAMIDDATESVSAYTPEEAWGTSEEAAEVPNTDDAESISTPEPARSSALSVLGLVIVALLALVIGIGLFKSFEILWKNLDWWLTTLLGVVVTGVIVGLVHALRTERDATSMTIAGVAGLAVTFGPFFISGL